EGRNLPRPKFQSSTWWQHFVLASQIDFRKVIQSLVEPGQKCKIICDAAYPIPESTSCAVTGWTVKSENVRCDATKGGLSPAGQMGVVGAFLIVVCLVTAIYQYKKSKPQVRPIREATQQTFVQHQIQNYQHVRPQLHQNTAFYVHH
ncbi:unnamed protein product, partial [Oikopleura dioica]